MLINRRIHRENRFRIDAVITDFFPILPKCFTNASIFSGNELQVRTAFRMDKLLMALSIY